MSLHASVAAIEPECQRLEAGPDGGVEGSGDELALCVQLYFDNIERTLVLTV